MKKNCVSYNPPTREALDSIRVGDLVKCNDWQRPFRVVGVSENFFAMTQNMFGDTHYSVCEKRPSSHTRNYREEGCFTIGPDFWLFGAPQFPHGYNWDDEEAVAAYLASWETGETKFSRSAISLKRISVKACSPTGGAV